MSSNIFGVESFLEESFVIAVSKYSLWLDKMKDGYDNFEIISTTHTVSNGWFGKRLHYFTVTYKSSAYKSISLGYQRPIGKPGDEVTTL